jgi:hypothetical protein
MVEDKLYFPTSEDCWTRFHCQNVAIKLNRGWHLWERGREEYLDIRRSWFGGGGFEFWPLALKWELQFQKENRLRISRRVRGKGVKMNSTPSGRYMRISWESCLGAVELRNCRWLVVRMECGSEWGLNNIEERRSKEINFLQVNMHNIFNCQAIILQTWLIFRNSVFEYKSDRRKIRYLFN